MYTRATLPTHHGARSSFTQNWVRPDKCEGAPASQKQVRFCFPDPAMRVSAETGTPQNWVRTVEKWRPSPLSQNWVRNRAARRADFAIPTQWASVRAKNVPDSAWISVPTAGTRHDREGRQARGRRNGYAFYRSRCGKPCGISRLSPQNPVRCLR